MVKGDEYHPIRIPVSEEEDGTGYGVSIFDLGDKDETNWPVDGRSYEQSKPEETGSTGGETMTEETYDVSSYDDPGASMVFGELWENAEKYANEAGVDIGSMDDGELAALGTAGAIYQIEQGKYEAEDIELLQHVVDSATEMGVDTEKVGDYKADLGGNQFSGLHAKAFKRAREMNHVKQTLEARKDIWEGLFFETARDKKEALGELKGAYKALEDLDTDTSSIEDSNLDAAAGVEQDSNDLVDDIQDIADGF